MNRPKLFAAPLLGIFLVVSAVAPPTPVRKVERDTQTLLKLEDRWLATEDNPDALRLILADDFIHVLPAGFITKAEQIGYITKHGLPEARRRKSFEDERVRIYGDAGIVTGAVITELADGSKTKFYFTDVFAYRQGIWQAVNAQELNPPQS
jgi:hypothetical protein